MQCELRRTAVGQPAYSDRNRKTRRLAGSRKLTGHRLGADFAPEITDSGQPLTSPRFKELITGMGLQWLSEAETGKPFEADQSLD